MSKTEIEQKLAQARKDKTDVVAKMDANIKELEDQLKPQVGDKYRGKYSTDVVVIVISDDRYVVLGSPVRGDIGSVHTGFSNWVNTYTKI